eukprot:CAMPEP_0172391724 /NCGR_PEP_ID=MMETSP1061-20121228/8057_1 /TAXON_ID=37318 /ORGANISM="Pseudo-nitzschia pungens, Strain cf. pungens" /LENGTH=599 /DNA_ID=CAMNT_0013122417 /DNA_START=118 /DNA_END=1917 /DNA_ORIENTATION=-
MMMDASLKPIWAGPVAYGSAIEGFACGSFPCSYEPSTSTGAFGCSFAEEDIDGMIDELGFFQDEKESDKNSHHNENDILKREVRSDENTKTPINTPDSILSNGNSDSSSSSSSSDGSVSTSTSSVLTKAQRVVLVNTSSATAVTPPPAPTYFVTNDTGAIAPVPDPLATFASSEPLSKPQIEVFPNNNDSHKSTASTPSTCKQQQQQQQQQSQPVTLNTPIPGNAGMSFESVLQQQRETILRNQEIIEAQKNELRQAKHKKPVPEQLQPATTTAQTATSMVASPLTAPLPMPATCLGGAFGIVGGSTSTSTTTSPSPSGVQYNNYGSMTTAIATTDTTVAAAVAVAVAVAAPTNTKKRKSPSVPDSVASTSSSGSNTYKKWKLSSACTHQLPSLESNTVLSSSIASSHCSEDAARNYKPAGAAGAPDEMVASGKHQLTRIELEVRRERNRKHAKKSRLRKKSLTSDLEHALELLREENTKLRACITNHIARKQQPSESTDALLEKHRVRSHEQFVYYILNNPASPSSSSRSKKSSKRKVGSTSASASASVSVSSGSHKNTSNANSPSGKGVVVDDKTIKALRGLTKALVASQPGLVRKE